MDDQLKRIFKVLGTPTEETWPGVVSLPEYKPYPNYNPIPNFRQIIPNLSVSGRDLIQKLIVCNPNNRLSADAALRHPYFIYH